MGKDLNGKKLPSGISQRDNGLYVGRVMFDGVRHTLYNRSLTDLKKEMIDLKYQLEHGTYVVKSKVNLKDWFETWLREYKESTVKGNSVRAYEHSIKHWKPLEKMKLSDIHAANIQKVLNDMVKEGFSQSTIELAFVVLSNALKYAYKMGLIESNPCDKVILPKSTKQKKAGIALTKDQQETFLKYSEDSYLNDYFRLCLQTGMRGGELSGLKFSDIDFKNNLIHVNRTLLQTGDTDTPKTKTSLRTIPATDAAMEILRHRKEENRELQGNIININDNDYVFTVNGQPIGHSRTYREINRIKDNIAKAGLDFPEDFTLHSLRHTFATRAAEAGIDLNTLKNIMGHSSLSMTADLYSHVMEDQKRAEIDRVAAAL